MVLFSIYSLVKRLFEIFEYVCLLIMEVEGWVYNGGEYLCRKYIGNCDSKLKVIIMILIFLIVIGWLCRESCRLWNIKLYW